MNPLLESFIQESRENLQHGAQSLLKLEKSADDKSIINEVFRSIHTIKGSAGLFDIHPLASLVHALEDLFDGLRNGIGVVNSEIIDIALDSLDQVSTWLGELELHERLPDNGETTAQEFIGRIRQVSQIDIAIEAPEEAVLADASVALTIPDILQQVSHQQRQSWWQAGTALFWLHYQPDEQCFFSGEDPLRTMQLMPGLEAWQCTSSLAPFDETFDPFQCQLAFDVLTSASEDSIREHTKYIAEQVTLVAIAPEQLLFCHGSDAEHDLLAELREQARQTPEAELTQLLAPVKNILNPESTAWQAVDWYLLAGQAALPLLQSTLNFDVLTQRQPAPRLDAQQTDAQVETQSDAQRLNVPPEVAQQVWQTQIDVLESVSDASIIAGTIAAVASVLVNSVELVAPALQPDLHQAIAQASQDNSVAPLIQVIERALADNAPFGSEEVVAPPASLAATAVVEPQKPAQSGTESKGATMLRVDQRKIDQLMDLAGELIVAKNALPFIAENAEKKHGNRQISKDIKAQYQVLDRLVSAMQEGIMSVRMVPVSSVFQRFPRLVRDIARKIDKQIDLTLIGETTEADKNVIESLVDPLVHMIRNSVDHGIEPPAERKARGKPVVGQLVLSATPQEDQVLIQLRDDGKGIDPQVIKEKALQKGVIDQDTFERLTDAEAQQLIFAAGFSSRDTASDLSGRGVGMDVVKNAVESAGGTVELASVVGEGTTISLHLPLSVAVSRVMRIQVSGQQYGIPMDLINETVRIPASRVQTVRNRRTIVLRDTLVPIKSLANLLAIDPIPEKDEVSLLIVSTRRGILGLEVDDFLGDLEIIQKPMVGFMREFTAYSGATMLGDGRVLLVLNVEDLL